MRPREPAEYVLAGLLVAGLCLRVFAAWAWWPATTNLSDSAAYAVAGSDPLDSALHQPGYPLLLALLGVFSDEIAVPVALQHLSAFATALLLYAAVRRLTGTPWPGLLGAGVVLLGADLIFLEHSVLPASAFALALAAVFYLAVRAFDAPRPWLRWPLACALALAAAALIVPAALLLIPFVAAAIALAVPAGSGSRLAIGGLVAAAACAAVLVASLVAGLAGGRYGVLPSPGWHAYARVAPFADCTRTEPPAGTEGLCETVPVSRRPGAAYYLHLPDSPARREFGPTGEQDGAVGSFARAVVLNQFWDYMNTVRDDIEGYFVPGGYPFRFGSGTDLDPLLDWGAPGAGGGSAPSEVEVANQTALERFFGPFTVDREPDGLAQLHDYQRVFRFGATALCICSLLIGAGLVLGSRRSRAGVLLFGGSLAVIAGSAFVLPYSALSTVPLAGGIAAGAAVAATSLWRLEAWRRRAPAGAGLAPEGARR